NVRQSVDEKRDVGSPIDPCRFVLRLFFQELYRPRVLSLLVQPAQRIRMRWLNANVSMCRPVTNYVCITISGTEQSVREDDYRVGTAALRHGDAHRNGLVPAGVRQL